MLMATASGKIILLGEHAVVYGQPAIAVPFRALQATAMVAARDSAPVWIEAPDLERRYRLDAASPGDPLALAVRNAAQRLRLPLHGLVITVRSTLPVASGLGSGAAVCTALVRALAEFAGQTLVPDEVSAIVYESEKLLHGTPSGIDNTVIAHDRPVFFIKGQGPLPLAVVRPYTFLVADTGVPSPTRHVVADVRAAATRQPERYQPLFAEIGATVRAARALMTGEAEGELGPLLTRNHALLRELEVSSEALDTLVVAAVSAGALGAKLSGGGRGGNMIALVDDDSVEAVRAALQGSGAKAVYQTDFGDD
jgi:mevalonate kinase